MYANMSTNFRKPLFRMDMSPFLLKHMYYVLFAFKASSCGINPGSSTPQNNSCTVTYLPSLKPSKNKTLRKKFEHLSRYYALFQKMSLVNDQLEHTYSSYVRIRDVALKTCQRRWMIGRSGERGSGISVLAARHDDDDERYEPSYPSSYELNSIIAVLQG